MESDRCCLRNQTKLSHSLSGQSRQEAAKDEDGGLSGDTQSKSTTTVLRMPPVSECKSKNQYMSCSVPEWLKFCESLFPLLTPQLEAKWSALSVLPLRLYPRLTGQCGLPEPQSRHGDNPSDPLNFLRTKCRRKRLGLQRLRSKENHTKLVYILSSININKL